MSKTKPTRLQGPEWHSKKDSLLMTKYRINEKGHVKGFYTDMEGNLYSHWFSDKEIEELKEQPEEDTVTAYKEAIHHMGVDFGKGPDHTNISLNIPTISDLDIEKSIDNVLSREELIKQMNDFVLEDERERYVRALLNRLHKITTYMEEFVHDMETGGINVDLVIDIAKGNDINKYEEFFKYGDEHQQELFEMLKSKGDINE